MRAIGHFFSMQRSGEVSLRNFWQAIKLLSYSLGGIFHKSSAMAAEAISMCMHFCSKGCSCHASQ